MSGIGHCRTGPMDTDGEASKSAVAADPAHARECLEVLGTEVLPRVRAELA